jgi:hypothetical protein
MTEQLKLNLSGSVKKIQNNITEDSTLYMREYMRLYIKNQPKIRCECGLLIKNYHKYKHIKTKLHHNILKTLNMLNDSITV